MKKLAVVLFALVCALPQRASAWEAETTQAGLAEQAALGSKLHRRIVTLGFGGGLFEQLTIPPADAHALLDDLHLLSPAEGIVPDARGRQTALAWIAAGAALADIRAAYGANHFFDPATGKGWERPDRGLLASIAAAFRATLPEHGMPAPDWVVSKDNPMGLDAFLEHYAKAGSAASQGERSRHLAAALLAAGAMIHVLGDLGSPSRVRSDEAAHLDPLGGGPQDLGSRFERIAALAYGRLGIPSPTRPVTRAHLRDYYTAKDGSGLADVISRSYFSPHTLPSDARVGGNEVPELARPLPALPKRLNLMAASRDDGAKLVNSAGVCLARYKVEHSRVTFSLDDDCMLEEVAAILPEVSSYEAGLLDFLLRGELTIANNGGALTVTGKDLGPGSIQLYVEDDRGVRSALGAAIAVETTVAPAAGAPLARVPLPATGTRVVAVFRGADPNGEPLVAIGSMPLVH